MSSPYGSNFDGTNWPWTLDGEDDWFALHDAAGQYVSDACVEGNRESWTDAVNALRSGCGYHAKRMAIAFDRDEVHLWSPRNSVGRHARLSKSLAGELADIIAATLGLDAPDLAAENARLRALLAEALNAVEMIPEQHAYDLRDRITAALEVKP